MFSRSSSFYELLEVPLDADRSTVMNAWMDKRREAVGMMPVLGAEEVDALCSRLDEAFRILTHPLRGKRYQRYHRFSVAAKASGEVEQPASASELPSILEVSVRRGAPAGPGGVGRDGWLQMSLPLLAEVEGETSVEVVPPGRSPGEDEASVTACDELQAAAPIAAALEVGARGLLTGELLDTLELLEEALGSEPGVPAVKFRVV